MNYTESETVELKSIVTEDIKKELIAFANCNGGKLYVGITDDGTMIGIANPDETMLQITSMVRDSIKPDITMFLHYETITVEGKQIIAIDIQRGTNRPYYLSKKGLRPEGVYVRQGTASVPASDEAIRTMIKETDGNNFEDARAMQQELTFFAAEKEFAQRQVDFGLQQKKTLGILTIDMMYTNLGLLLSDQCPHTIKIASFAGTDQNQFQDRREFSGSLFQQLNDAYAYIDLHNHTQATFEKLYRIDTRDYPEVAVREALLNALVHRDYSYLSSIIIGIYEDRIEFVSIGGLMPGITLNDVLIGLSICRNAKLANVFYRMELIEAYGTGLNKIITAYASCERKPQIIASDHAFKLILPNKNYKQSGPTDNMIVHETPGTYQVYHPTAVPYQNTSTAAEQVILLAQKNHLISRREVQEILNVGQSTAGRLLKQMLEDGVLLQQGSGKNTRYYLPNEY